MNFYRTLRIKIKKMRGIEPKISVQYIIKQVFHGNDYCGWSIPTDRLHADSIVIDVGLGEDISFSTSLIDNYKCIVHGFDPTPRAIEYVKNLAFPNFLLHEYGVSSKGGPASFYLPNKYLLKSPNISNNVE